MKKLFVCLFAASMALVLIGSAVAAGWGFYGSARMGTWWYSRWSMKTMCPAGGLKA